MAPRSVVASTTIFATFAALCGVAYVVYLWRERRADARYAAEVREANERAVEDWARTFRECAGCGCAYVKQLTSCPFCKHVSSD